MSALPRATVRWTTGRAWSMLLSTSCTRREASSMFARFAMVRAAVNGSEGEGEEGGARSRIERRDERKKAELSSARVDIYRGEGGTER